MDHRLDISKLISPFFDWERRFTILSFIPSSVPTHSLVQQQNMGMPLAYFSATLKADLVRATSPQYRPETSSLVRRRLDGDRRTTPES